MSITTRVAPCIRYVLVRNAQCEKHMKQQDGNMDGTPGSESVLTPQGNEMAKSLRHLIEYIETRGYCVPSGSEPKREYTIVVDGNAQQHYDTSSYLRQDNKVTLVYASDIREQLQSFVVTDVMKVVIAFTDARTIIDACGVNIDNKLSLGPALGSTTIFDVLADGSIFVHEFGGLGALQYGGFDTSKLFWWNNSS